MSVYSESTIEKFRKEMAKLIEESDYSDYKSYIFKNPQEMWNYYHADIASKIFYILKDEMHKYSSFDNADDPGTEDYKLWDEFEDELKAIFIKTAKEWLVFDSDDSNTTANIEEIIWIAKKMSPDDIKKTIVRLLNMI